MNYIAEMNAFYDWLETNPLSQHGILLWLALMQVNNKAGWQKEFAVAISVLALKTGGVSRRSIERARNELQQKGRIKWKERAGNQSAVYAIIPFVRHTGVQPVAQVDVQPVVQPVVQVDAINKLNETKLNETNHSTSDSARKTFTPPTVDEVAEYCSKRNNGIDADFFIDYYATRGWMLGKVKMKDWQAAVRTWERRNKGGRKEGTGNVFLDLLKEEESRE